MPGFRSIRRWTVSASVDYFGSQRAVDQPSSLPREARVRSLIDIPAAIVPASCHDHKIRLRCAGSVRIAGFNDRRYSPSHSHVRPLFFETVTLSPMQSQIVSPVTSIAT
jgi:hypothetical protein